MSFRKKLVITMKNLYKLHPKNISGILACITYNHAAPPVRQAGIHSFLATADVRNINR